MQSGGAPEQPGNGNCPEAAQQQQAGQFGGGDGHTVHTLSSQTHHRGSFVRPFSYNYRPQLPNRNAMHFGTDCPHPTTIPNPWEGQDG